MGNRFRLVVNQLEWWTCQRPCRNSRWPAPCGNPLPDLQTSAEAWILAGAAHHSVFTQAVDIRAAAHLRRHHGYRVCGHRQAHLHPALRSSCAGTGLLNTWLTPSRHNDSPPAAGLFLLAPSGMTLLPSSGQ